ncbi:TRAP transporter permease [Streptomyces apocyni]|uniref:TRAP transporter permease n=1 Tax=Streptomyces apocyni TaxID=2654677 RepID=UPI0018D0FA0F|nr:TRAP transporter fused permease subunit [Streptomyces apocyni]
MTAESQAPQDPQASEAPPAPPAPLWHRLAAERWGDGRAATAVGIATLVIAVALGAFQLYTAVQLDMDAYIQRALHLMFVLVLVFLLKGRRGLLAASLDLVLVLVAVAVMVYPVVYFDEIARRTGDPTTADLVMGGLAMLLLLEATRRTIGLFMVLVIVGFLAYAWFGPWLPDAIAHRGFTIQRIIHHSYLFQGGIFGIPLGVAATFVFMFIFFGAVLEKTGGGAFFINTATALTGRYRGGPAKAAVVGSAFMGSVSGSAIANAVTTGTFTIPLMRRVGYKPHEAAGVEAAASTGGQLLPPIMGAGAFIMAQMSGIPYTEIVKASIIPALMYFVTIFFFVDILARRGGLSGLSGPDLPALRPVLASGWHFVIPFAVLVWLLAEDRTPLVAGLYATVALTVVALTRVAYARLRAREGLDLRAVASGTGEAFVIAARNTLGVTVATAAAGIVVGMVGLTGLGLKFSSLMVDLGQGQLLLTLLTVAVASLILGLGLPVTASYVVLIVLAGPALTDLGLPVIVAHMIVYWYSQDSNVTPPVALVAFAASGIAGSSPTRTGFAAWKFAKGLYLIPVMMAYSPLLGGGTPLEIAAAAASGTLALLAFAVAIEGYWLTPVNLATRLALGLASVLLLVPALLSPDEPLLAGVPGAVLVAIVLALQVRGRERAPKTAP